LGLNYQEKLELEKNNINMNLYIKRFFASLIDFYFVGFLVTIPAFLFWSKLINESRIELYIIIYQFICVLVYILYWYILEKYYHTTLGKKLLKLQVIDNEKSNFLIRSIFKFVPLDVISFLFTKDGKFWHDIFSHTEVVEKK